MPATVGVLALQGGVREHRLLLESLGARVSLVRSAGDLIGPDGPRVDALVLPGGESSTIDKLVRTFDLYEPLQQVILRGLPTLGTCAGLVLLACEVVDPAPGQRSLGVMDVTVRRNALGPQVDSAEVCLPTPFGPVQVAFIRAPVVTQVGPAVEILARRESKVVGVRQRMVTGIAFHPELTGEPAFHRRLLADVARGVVAA
ncbi:MAG TPA: pyridoxal 5'-phosphate synthase glutaminase subunit PdxT [Propionicimonas sp.]